jgi:hypothetical protein
LSWQAAGIGKHRLQQVLAVHPLQLVGTRAPPRFRGTARASVLLQRQRVSKIGDWMSACVGVSGSEFGCR